MYVPDSASVTQEARARTENRGIVSRQDAACDPRRSP